MYIFINYLAIKKCVNGLLEKISAVILAAEIGSCLQPIEGDVCLVPPCQFFQVIIQKV